MHGGEQISNLKKKKISFDKYAKVTGMESFEKYKITRRKTITWIGKVHEHLCKFCILHRR